MSAPMLKSPGLATLINDHGQTVPAVGEVGSIERAQCEWPRLIEEMRRRRANGALSRYQASRLMGSAKIQLVQERTAVLQAAGFDEQEARAMQGWS